MKANGRAFLEKLANDNINYKIVHDASNSLKHSVRTGKNSLSGNFVDFAFGAATCQAKS